jgi:hypothetical protein
MILDLPVSFREFDVGSIIAFLWLGSRLSIFFRRRFEVSSQHIRPVRDLSSLGMALLVQRIGLLASELGKWQTVDPNCMLLLLGSSLIELVTRLETAQEVIKSFILAYSIHLAVYAPVEDLVWIAVCVVAATQLSRWPESLKHQLRGVRTVCGPCYAILVVGAYAKESNGYFKYSFNSAVTVESTSPTLKCAAMASVLASIVFRPDNQQLWNALFKHQTFVASVRIFDGNRHKYVHACLMLLSYGCMLAKFKQLKYDHLRRLLGTAFVVMSLIGLVMGASFMSKAHTSQSITFG